MRLRLRFGRAAWADHEIELYPVYGGWTDPDMGFGTVRDFIISPKGRRIEAGRISVRLGESPCIYYFGHIGYHIDFKWRGHGWAERACRLVAPEFLRAGKRSVVITCDPDNQPSRKTCEHLGARLERTVDVPGEIRDRWEISPVKCRYIWELPAGIHEEA